MIESKDILPYGRYAYGQPFIGSYKGMKYKIVHPKKDEYFYVEIWPGPYCYEKTDESKFIKTTFLYGEEGYNQLVPYLNSVYEEHQDMWNA